MGGIRLPARARGPTAVVHVEDAVHVLSLVGRQARIAPREIGEAARTLRPRSLLVLCALCHLSAFMVLMLTLAFSASQRLCGEPSFLMQPAQSIPRRKHS